MGTYCDHIDLQILTDLQVLRPLYQPHTYPRIRKGCFGMPLLVCTDAGLASACNGSTGFIYIRRLRVHPS